MRIFRPLKSSLQTQGFGLKGTKPDMLPKYQAMGLTAHNGWDWIARKGEPIYWPCDIKGMVLDNHIDNKGGLGVRVITESKKEGLMKHLFWHLEGFACKAGDVVNAGDVLGYADSTGFSTGHHLHYGLKPVAKDKNGNFYNLHQDNGYFGAIDPASFMQAAYIKDYIKHLETHASCLQKILKLILQLINIKLLLKSRK